MYDICIHKYLWLLLTALRFSDTKAHTVALLSVCCRIPKHQIQCIIFSIGPIEFPLLLLNELVLREPTGNEGPEAAELHFCCSEIFFPQFRNSLQTIFPRVHHFMPLLYPVSINHFYLQWQKELQSLHIQDPTIHQSFHIKLGGGVNTHISLSCLPLEISITIFKTSSGQLNTNKTIIYKARVLIDSSLKILLIKMLSSKCVSFACATHLLPTCLLAFMSLREYQQHYWNALQTRPLHASEKTNARKYRT